MLCWFSTFSLFFFFFLFSFFSLYPFVSNFHFLCPVQSKQNKNFKKYIKEIFFVLTTYDCLYLIDYIFDPFLLVVLAGVF